MKKEQQATKTTQITKNLKGEAFFILGANESGYITFLGLGKVCNVRKGERVDQVIIHFGVKPRSMYVVDNHARRQLFLLKRGQYTFVVGTYAVKVEKGKTIRQLFARGFMPWYVPKMLDIKKYDTSEIEKLEDENDQDLTTFLDDLLQGDIKI